MGLCQVFKNLTNKNTYEETMENHQINIAEFQQKNQDRCIYELGERDNQALVIVEHAPKKFNDLRESFGITPSNLFDSFSPVYNIQAIHNFFTGSGKSPSFFFFSDNKQLVLKTLKPSEKKLLLEQGILDSYYEYMMKNKGRSLLSKFYGAYSFQVQGAPEITCVIMDNLIGSDFMNITRIYDLKGSTVGRSVKLTQEQILSGNSGMKVLKDLNYIDLSEKLEGVKKSEIEGIHQILERDSIFLATNMLMDYSLLLIKVKTEVKVSTQNLQVMPAMVCVSNQDTGAVSFVLKTTKFDDIMNSISSKFSKMFKETKEQALNTKSNVIIRKTNTMIQEIEEERTVAEGETEEEFKEQFFSDEEQDGNKSMEADDVSTIGLAKFRQTSTLTTPHNGIQEEAISPFTQLIKNQIKANHTSTKEDSISRGNNFLLKSFLNISKKSDSSASSFLENGDTIGIYEAGDWKYKLGVIDFLTQYTNVKKLETKWNAVLHYKEAQNTSCQHPKDYQQRFIKFMEKHL